MNRNVSEEKEVMETYTWQWRSPGKMSSGKKVLVALGHSMSLSGCTVGEKQRDTYLYLRSWKIKCLSF